MQWGGWGGGLCGDEDDGDEDDELSPRVHSHREAPAASRFQGSLTIELRVAVNHRRDPDQDLAPVPLHNQRQPPAGLLDQLPGVAQGQVLGHGAVDLEEAPIGATFYAVFRKVKAKKFKRVPGGYLQDDVAFLQVAVTTGESGARHLFDEELAAETKTVLWGKNK